MGKISLVSAKYIIHAKIEIDGFVDKPDVIGAIFGQTEGLLGSELELRELQRSGRIGRIEVDLSQKNGKTSGLITLPSSLDMSEVSIVGAAMEVIQRIGPCGAKITVESIEDVRVSKRKQVIARAKELLKNLIDSFMPDSSEIAEEVSHSVRMFEIRDYGQDKLPAGPMIEESDEIIIVEGRADVLNLLKYGFKNVIGMNGSSVPKTIIDLSKQKTITLFVDGDRGGELNIRELLSLAEIDFVTKAPDGKEVEELTKKEIHKALRSKVAAEQVQMEFEKNGPDESLRRNNFSDRQDRHQDNKGHSQNRGQSQYNQRSNERSDNRDNRPNEQKSPERKPVQRFEKDEKTQNLQIASPQQGMNKEVKNMFKSLLEEVIGSKGAYLLNGDYKLLGKVPITELLPTISNLEDVDSVVIDGNLDEDLLKKLEKTGIKRVIAVGSKAVSSQIEILTSKNLT